MEFFQPKLVRIVEQASSLTERLKTGFLPSDPTETDDIVNSRIENWYQIATKGNQEKFQKRLAWDGLTLSTVSRVLGNVRISDPQNLPGWVETFKAGIEAAASISVETLEPGEAHPCLDSQNPIPFEEVFLPFIQIARDKLIALTGDSYHCLTAEAHADLERSFLVSLSRLCSYAMELKFSAFRARRQSALSRLLGLQNSQSKTHYRAFIKQMLQGGGLLVFFQEYPVLAWLVATVTDFWVDATGEFIQRLAANLSDIQQTFQPDTELGQVDNINSSMSDPHNQGRSVIGVEFASGLKLIYKPKDLGLEVGYFQLLDWCNQHFVDTRNLPSLQPFKLLKVINRSTYGWVEFYASVLQKSLQPQYLRDGADHSIQLDILSRPFLWTDSQHPFWSILKAELQALEQLDIPYFATDSDSDALPVSASETIEQCFTEPSYNRMIAQLQRLNDDDLAQQVTIIRSSLYSMVAGELGTASTDVEVPATSLLDDGVSPITQEVLVQQAMQFAQDLQRRAIRADDGSATWIGLGFLPQANRFQLQPIAYGLYDGCCGVALFLAALTKITGDSKCRDLCLGALQPLRKILQDSDPESRQKLAGQIGIGGATGLGSIVYSLVRISQFLDDATVLEDAKQAAPLITPDSIATDKEFDILSGAAGAILGLLALYQVSADSGILAQGTTCAQHLLNHRVVSDTGFRAWANVTEKPLTGFSHGAAGIAYALLRLYEVTQDAVMRRAAEEAIAYERSLFSPTDGNWPDLRSFARSSRKPSYMTSWCHGAPGIGLARLGSLAIFDTPQIREEIAVALNTTLQFGLQDIDHPCCGNCGRIEVLLVAAEKLLRPDLLEIVQKQASSVVARAKQVGGFYLFPNLPKDVYNPGFFQGTAGIGYELLRLATPSSLPSVLLWE